MYRKVIWSPVEIEWLSKNKTLPYTQLTAALAKSTTAVKRKLAELEGKTPKVRTKKRQVSKIGRRKDCDNLFFRSAWEANFYRYLRSLPEVALIEVEPTTFSFAPHGILKGTVSYTPDFKVTYQDGRYSWYEIKGYLKRQDKTKLRRFKKFYPEEFEALGAVTGSATTQATEFFESIGVPVAYYYNELKRTCASTIPGWES